MDKTELIQKWIEGTLSEQERAHFEQSEEYKSLVEVSDRIAEFKAPEYDVEGELSKLKPKLKPKKTRTITLSQLAFRVAALVVITVGLAYLLLPTTTSELREISSEEISELALPDNSEVSLNAASTISFDAENWEENRKVNLTGEAYFEVAKGQLFEVKTVTGAVQVLGTSFNVRDRDGILEVTCYSGSVGVSANGKEVILTKNQKVAMSAGSLPDKTTINTQAPSWIDGISTFESTDFINVVKEFERQHNVKIKLDNIDPTVQFTGTFSNSDMEVALKSITLPLHLSYQITKDQIVLSKPDQ